MRTSAGRSRHGRLGLREGLPWLGYLAPELLLAVARLCQAAGRREEEVCTHSSLESWQLTWRRGD